jgi:hypothetical protein
MNSKVIANEIHQCTDPSAHPTGHAARFRCTHYWEGEMQDRVLPGKMMSQRIQRQNELESFVEYSDSASCAPPTNRIGPISFASSTGQTLESLYIRPLFPQK